MGPKITVISLIVLIAGVSYYVIDDLPTPSVDLHQYWGPSSEGRKPQSDIIEKFSLNYSEGTINELRKKLSEPSHLRESLENTGFRYGFNKNTLSDWIVYWRDTYLSKWTERQSYLNKFPHYTTKIQGLNIHFIHARDSGKSKNIVPLLLLHGWPGSVREFYEIIPLLTKGNEDTAFIVVAPSLPGYGWSEGASVAGLNPSKIAIIMRNLMVRLGYDRFIIQGGDWGSIIGSAIAVLFPQNVIAYHSNMCTSSIFSTTSIFKKFIASFYPPLFIPGEFADFVFPAMEKLPNILEESGYFHLQATKPDTIGVALSQSPVGLAAYILEKFSTWTNLKYRDTNDGGFSNHYNRDALLDNIMIYYLTGSITTSMRLYAEAMTKDYINTKIDQVPTSVLTGCARFKHDLAHELDWNLQSKYKNLIHSTYHHNGGHFIALELPNVLYNDFIEFVHKVSNLEKLE